FPGMHPYVEEALRALTLVARLLVIIVVGSVKALLPAGILPKKDVRGEICLITGAGSGLGRLMAIEFAKRGCILVLWDVNTAGNSETKAIIGEGGETVHTYTVDLSKREQINEAAARVAREVGKVGILINNAGVVTGKRLVDSPDEWIERTMAVNTSACIYTTKNFVGGMIERNHGHIVTIASMAGKIGLSGIVDYTASKFGAVGFHESLVAELRHVGADGVKATLVCPYVINTGMFAGFENKSPGIVPTLEPEYVVDRIVEAVLTNQAELQMPKIAYLMMGLVNILPSEAKHALFEYLGQYDGMDTFKGRTPFSK
ncbi:hypothetical protein PMAYCL1PPCAC_15074, partial [Pristionchus mayeri]